MGVRDGHRSGFLGAVVWFCHQGFCSQVPKDEVGMPACPKFRPSPAVGQTDVCHLLLVPFSPSWVQTGLVGPASTSWASLPDGGMVHS